MLQIFADKGLVFPVHSNKFKIGINGLSSSTEDMTIIRGLETFSPSIEGQVENWFAMDEEGWQRSLVTGKALSFAFSGKRQVGDAGNDYVFSKALSTGTDCNSLFEWEMPSGSVLQFDCVINVTVPGGGDTTNVDSLEFELYCDGKPTFLEAQVPPTGLTGVKPTTEGGIDGKISGTTIAMEFRATGSSTYTDCTATNTTVGAAGTYYVRFAATETKLASNDITVVVPVYSA